MLNFDEDPAEHGQISNHPAGPPSSPASVPGVLLAGLELGNVGFPGCAASRQSFPHPCALQGRKLILPLSIAALLDFIPNQSQKWILKYQNPPPDTELPFPTRIYNSPPRPHILFYIPAHLLTI